MSSLFPDDFKWHVNRAPAEATVSGVAVDLATQIHIGILTLSLNTGFGGFKMRDVIVETDADKTITLGAVLAAIRDFYLQPTTNAEVTELETHLNNGYEDFTADQTDSVVAPLRARLNNGQQLTRAALLEGTSIQGDDLQGGTCTIHVY